MLTPNVMSVQVTSICMDGWMDGWLDEWRDGWMGVVFNRHMKAFKLFFFFPPSHSYCAS